MSPVTLMLISPVASGRGPKEHAKELIKLVKGATLGELSSLDEILRLLTSGSQQSQQQAVQLGVAQKAVKERTYELHKDVVANVIRYEQMSVADLNGGIVRWHAI